MDKHLQYWRRAGIRRTLFYTINEMGEGIMYRGRGLEIHGSSCQGAPIPNNHISHNGVTGTRRNKYKISVKKMNQADQ